jgi:uncharacterized protein YneF (UPF0154 family)
MSFFDYGLVGVLVVVVLVATYGLLGFAARKHVEDEFEDPEDILAAVKIYESYAQRKAAIKLLEKGLEKNPRHSELERKLAELKAASS